MLCAALAGCAGKSLCHPKIPGRMLLGAEYEPRGTAEIPAPFPALADLPPVPAPPVTGSVRILTPAEVQCTAAANAALGNLLEIEAQITLARPVKRQDDIETAQSEARLLRLRATDQRNRAAGAALELYYRLLEAEAGVDTLKLSAERIGWAASQIDLLRERGLELPPELDRGTWERQRLDVSRRHDELAASRLQLNQRLAHLLALPGEEPGPLWPKFTWRLAEAPPAMEPSVALGLHTRADLQGIRMLRGLNTENGLSTIRSGLRQADATLGLPPGAKLFAMMEARRSAEVEIPLRQAQVAILDEDRTRAAADEIREAIAGIAESRRLAAAAHAQWNSWKARVEELELKRNGEITAFDIHAAYLQMLSARQEVFTQLTAVELAWVELHKSQGLLANQCGHGCPPQGCELHVTIPRSGMLPAEAMGAESIPPGRLEGTKESAPLVPPRVPPREEAEGPLAPAEIPMPLPLPPISGEGGFEEPPPVITEPNEPAPLPGALPDLSPPPEPLSPPTPPEPAEEKPPLAPLPDDL